MSCLMGLREMRELLYGKHSSEETPYKQKAFLATSLKGLTSRAYELKNIQLQKIPKHL